MCDVTRRLFPDEPGVFVSRKLPPTYPELQSEAVIWNRMGGADPTAIMQCRVFAATDQRTNALARLVAARLPLARRLDSRIINIEQNEGPTDMGPDPTPMMQMMWEITFRGNQLT